MYGANNTFLDEKYILENLTSQVVVLGYLFRYTPFFKEIVC